MNMNKVPAGAMPTEKDMDPNDNIPWYLKYGARVVGTIASLCEYCTSCNMVLII